VRIAVEPRRRGWRIVVYGANNEQVLIGQLRRRRSDAMETVTQLKAALPAAPVIASFDQPDDVADWPQPSAPAAEPTPQQQETQP